MKGAHKRAPWFVWRGSWFVFHYGKRTTANRVKKELPIKEDSLIQQPRTDGAVKRLSFLIPRTDFDDLRLGIYIFRQGAVEEFDTDGADEKADDAADDSSLDRIEALGQGQEVAGKGTGCADQERHDETDEGADDDVDIAKFKFDVLADFDAQRVDGGDDDVVSPVTGAAGDAVRMAADLDFGRALFFYRNNCTFFNFHRNPFFLSLL